MPDATLTPEDAERLALLMTWHFKAFGVRLALVSALRGPVAPPDRNPAGAARPDRKRPRTE